MESELTAFERIVRRAFLSSERRAVVEHPFDERNVHPNLPSKVRELFDDGHYAEATFEAFKFVDNEIQRLSGDGDSGFSLMMRVFSSTSPIIKITRCTTTSEIDEQKGYQFLFAGSILAIRNPRGHRYGITDSPSACLDHLALASLLLRRLEKAGFTLIRLP